MTRSQVPPRPGLAFRLVRGALVFVALLLFGSYLVTRLLVVSAEERFPALGRIVRVEGLRQHVIERGAGDPIVFVHGAFGASQDFLATVVPELEQRYRCILWDRPGHGYSERPRVEADPGVQADLLLALCRELELEHPLLVGFSYGGAVTLTAGLRAPDELRGVVLLNGPSHPWPDPLELHYRLPTVPVIGRLFVETLLMPFAELTASSRFEHAFAPSPVDPRFADSSPVPLSLRPRSYRANAEDIRTLKPFLRGQADRYDQLDVPLFLVVSEADRVVSPTLHSPPLHAAVPDSTMRRLPDAGHQILYTHPGVVIETIDAAMAGEE